MSCFVEFWKWIFGCGREEEIERLPLLDRRSPPPIHVSERNHTPPPPPRTTTTPHRLPPSVAPLPTTTTATATATGGGNSRLVFSLSSSSDSLPLRAKSSLHRTTTAQESYATPSVAPLPVSTTSSASPNIRSSLSMQTNQSFVVRKSSLVVKVSAGHQRYEIPKDLEDLFKNDTVPAILRRPLSPSTYADYFAALLYSEDFYVQKWSNFLLEAVTLKFHEGVVSLNSHKTKERRKNVLIRGKVFVAFEVNEVPERRPYLLSRDFVYARPAAEVDKLYKGIIYRVVKSTTVLVEFGDDFHAQHSLSERYDVSFSFNRVCLKRCHQAVSALKDHILNDILFPKSTSRGATSLKLQPNLIHPHRTIAGTIQNHKGTLPYLIEGPLSTLYDNTGTHSDHVPVKLSQTGTIIQEAILKIFSTSPHCRILVCSPTNKACDALMRSLDKEIPRSDLFRANAAFRDYDLVPGDIIPQCLYEGECFKCPSLFDIKNFKVITCTFVSSSRLHAVGVDDNHFTHIFLVDASAAIEPEVVIPLANLIGENMTVVVSGSSTNYPSFVRSDIARRHGLKKSYFQRLLEREPYLSRDPMFISHIG